MPGRGVERVHRVRRDSKVGKHGPEPAVPKVRPHHKGGHDRNAAVLASDTNRLDAIVQCGTNMSLLNVTERLEPVIGIPILGINAVLFWYALRENGIVTALQGAGRLFREF